MMKYELKKKSEKSQKWQCKQMDTGKYEKYFYEGLDLIFFTEHKMVCVTLQNRSIKFSTQRSSWWADVEYHSLMATRKCTKTKILTKTT